MHIAEMDLQQELEIRAPDQHGELQINGNFGAASISYIQPQYWKRRIQPPGPARNKLIQVQLHFLPYNYFKKITAHANSMLFTTVDKPCALCGVHLRDNIIRKRSKTDKKKKTQQKLNP